MIRVKFAKHGIEGDRRLEERGISPAEEPINSPSSQREKARKILSMS